MPKHIPMSTPVLAIYLNICGKCIIFTDVTPQILRIQFSLLRNSWIFRNNTSHKLNITINICYMNCHITCFRQNFRRWLTHMPAVNCGCLSQRCQWLSPARQTNQVKCICKLGNFLASVAACNKTPAFPPSLVIQWIEVRWTGDHSLLPMKLRRFDLMKLETKNVKNDGYS